MEIGIKRKYEGDFSDSKSQKLEEPVVGTRQSYKVWSDLLQSYIYFPSKGFYLSLMDDFKNKRLANLEKV